MPIGSPGSDPIRPTDRTRALRRAAPHPKSSVALSLALLLLALGPAPFGPVAALAQITTTSDEDPAPSGSLRAAVEASSPGETVVFQLDTSDDTTSQIDLRTSLSFDNSLTLDNSSLTWDPVAIEAPQTGSFLEIRDGVVLTLRDVGLVGIASGTNDDIVLESATSALVLDVERQDQALSADVIGAGSVVKEGSAALTLTGINSFTGGLTIRQGDLISDVIAIESVGGGIDLAPVGVVGRLVLDITGSDFLDATSPVITHSTAGSGSAWLVKRGEGRLDIVDASIASTLAILVEEGELAVGPETLAGNRSFTIDGPGTLAVQNQGFTSISAGGSVSGSGRLQSEALELVLTGDLTQFTGTLGVETLGILTVDPDAKPAGPLPFDVSLDGGVTSLVLVDDDDLTLSGNITGAGIFQKTGLGTTTLTGTHSHTGGTAVSSGELIGNTNNLQGAITLSGGSALRFDQSTDGIFAGVIGSAGVGTATVRKVGSGSLTFTQSQDFTGDLRVESGRIHFANAVDLPAASLSLGVGSTTSTATLSTDFDPALLPSGNTVAIGGNLTIASDGRVLVDLDDGNATLGAATPTSTVFRATGTVTIDPAATLVVALQPGSYDGSPQFDIVIGESGLSGDFAIEQDFFFLDLVGTDVGNAYRLTVSPSGATLGSVATTQNRRTVGDALDTLRFTGSGGDSAIQDVLDDLATLQTSAVDSTLDALAADDLAAATNVRLAAAARTWRGLSNRLALQRNQSIGHGIRREDRPTESRRERIDRMRRRNAAGDRAAPVEAAPPSDTNRQSRRWVAWLEGSGSLGELDSDDSKGYDYQLVGPILGADMALTPDFRVGFATAGTRYFYDVMGTKNEGEGSAVEGSLYGAWIGRPVEILIGARYAHSWIETERTIQLPSGQSRVDGEYEGDEFGLYAEITRAFGTPGRVEIAPLASLAYTHVTFDDFDESGSSPLRMRVEGDDIDSAMTSLGIRISLEREMDEGLRFRPRLRAAWNHEWADIERRIAGQFVAQAGSSQILQLEGAELPRDHGEISVGWEVGYAAYANLFIDWNGRFGEDLIENSVALGLRATW